MRTIYTIGHSQHPWEGFKALLMGARITALADLRSRPYSRFGQFNRPVLKARLEADAIAYHHFGQTLGGISADGGMVDYEAIAKTEPFHKALDEIEELAAESCLALMCAEHEPLDCHRFLLVGRRLTERGNAVKHILRDGRIERHADTEARLLDIAGIGQGDLLGGIDQALNRAYRARTKVLERKSR